MAPNAEPNCSLKNLGRRVGAPTSRKTSVTKRREAERKKTDEKASALERRGWQEQWNQYVEKVDSNMSKKGTQKLRKWTMSVGAYQQTNECCQEARSRQNARRLLKRPLRSKVRAGKSGKTDHRRSCFNLRTVGTDLRVHRGEDGGCRRQG